MNQELYESEHKKLCEEMARRYGDGWAKDGRVAKKIRDAAKQTARNYDNALKIGARFNIPAKEIFRQAIILKSQHQYDIDVAYNVITAGLSKGKTLEQITGVKPMEQKKPEPEDKVEEGKNPAEVFEN